MKFTKVLCTLAAALAVDANNAIKMNFNVRRGSSRQSISPRDDDAPKLHKRAGSLDMELQNEQTFYLVELEIGSNRDKVELLVDTGSSDMWVMSHQLTCEATRNQRRDLQSTEGRVGNELYNQISSREVEKIKDNKSRERFFVPKDAPAKIEKRERHLDNEEFRKKTNPGRKENTALASVTVSATNANNGASTNTCTSYGSFDTGNSDSFQRNDSVPAFLIAYADQTEADGFWGHDDVTIGNTTIDSLSFAVVNVTSSNIGVLGIGLAGLETTYANSYSGGYQYENLPLKMRNQGIISKNAYSLYLGRPDDSTGSILFGAIDHAKYEGQLQTVPIINSYAGFDNPLRIEVAVLGIHFNASSLDTIEVTLNTYGAVLDTGSTLSYLPRSLLSRFATILGATYSSSAQAYLIDCVTDRSVTIDFNFSGVHITVPLADLMINTRSSRTCYLGLLGQSSSTSYILFGDNVLRNAYVVYDLEDYEVSLAQVKYTSDEDVELISSSVPSAVRAQGYSSTSLSSGAESSTTQRATYASGTSGSTSTGSSGGETRVGAASSVTIKLFVVIGAVSSFVIFL